MSSSKPKKPGPKPFFDDTRREVARQLYAAGLSQRDVAQHLGCTHGTVGNEAKRNPEFAAQVREAKMKYELKALDQISAAGGKSWRAAAWLLERTRPERFEKAARHQPTFDQVSEFWKTCRRDLLRDIPHEQEHAMKKRLCVLADEFAASAGYPPQLARKLSPLPSPDTRPQPQPQRFREESTATSSYNERCHSLGVRPIWDFFPGFGFGEEPAPEALARSPVLRIVHRSRCEGTEFPWDIVSMLLDFEPNKELVARETAFWKPKFDAWEQEFKTAERAMIESIKACDRRAAASRESLQQSLELPPPIVKYPLPHIFPHHRANTATASTAATNTATANRQPPSTPRPVPCPLPAAATTPRTGFEIASGTVLGCVVGLLLSFALGGLLAGGLSAGNARPLTNALTSAIGVEFGPQQQLYPYPQTPDRWLGVDKIRPLSAKNGAGVRPVLAGAKQATLRQSPMKVLVQCVFTSPRITLAFGPRRGGTR